MESKKAYEYILFILNNVGRDIDFKYDYSILRDVADADRHYLEERLWNSFGGVNGNYLLAGYIPQLKEFDGMQRLKDNLGKYKVPSRASLEVAKVLAECTDEKEYYDIILKNISFKENDKYEYISCLSSMKKTKNYFELLKSLYLLVEDELDTMVVAECLLYFSGIVEDVDELSHNEKILKEINRICELNGDEKIEYINQFEEKTPMWV